MALIDTTLNLPGKFIAVCGLDGAGKTTLIDYISKFAERTGWEVVQTRQPTGEARKHPLFEKYIYQPLSRNEVDYRSIMCLLASDRLQHVHSVIKPALQAGKLVISDRYVYTAMAECRARGYGDQQWFFELCRQFPRPDATFLLVVPLETIVARLRARPPGRQSFVDIDRFRKLCAEFDLLAEQEGLLRVNTSRLPQETFASILAELTAVLQKPRQLGRQ